jgi:hypothetical protein
MIVIKPAFGVNIVESNLASSIGLAVFFPATICATWLYGITELRNV